MHVRHCTCASNLFPGTGFCDNFWNDKGGKSGFDILVLKHRNGKEVLKELADHLKARAVAEEAYVVSHCDVLPVTRSAVNCALSCHCSPSNDALVLQVAVKSVSCVTIALTSLVYFPTFTANATGTPSLC